MNYDTSTNSHSSGPPVSSTFSERMFDPTIPPKKRIRVPNSCMICRKRKIKCDQARPACNQCSKRNVPHLCHYEDPQWMHFVRDRAEPIKQHSVNGVLIGPDSAPATSHQNDNESAIQELLEKLRHIETALDLTQLFGQEQTVSSAEKQTLIPPANDIYDPKEPVKLVDKQPFLVSFVMRRSRIEFHGCFSPIYDIKTDNYLKVIWLHMWRYLDLAIQDSLTSGNESLYSFKEAPLSSVILTFLEVRRQKSIYKQFSQRLTAAVRPLDDIIMEYMPQWRVIMTLCTRYFKYFYPLFPLLEEEIFITDVNAVMGELVNANLKPEKLNITTSVDYTIVGLLFIIMGISALTLSKDEVENNIDLRLLKDTSTAMYAVIARMCIEQHKMMQKSNNPKVALLLMHLKFYDSICFENDTISDRTMGQTSLGLINSILRSNGYHVDPSHLTGTSQGDGKLEAWRRLWHKLMELDSTEAAVRGHLPMFTDDFSYDTELPGLGPGLAPKAVDSFVVKDYQFMKRKTDLYRKITSTLFQRKRMPTLGQLLEFIEDLRAFSESELGSLSEILSTNTLPYARVKKAVYLLELGTFQAGLLQRTVSHAHLARNEKLIHQQYVKLNSSLTKTLNTALNICYNTDTYFGASYFVFIRPALFNAVIRLCLSFATLLGRCLHCIKRTPFNDHARLGALRELRIAIGTNLKRSSDLSLKLNIGYCNAQRISMGLSFFVVMIVDASFDFDKAYEDTTTRPIPDDHARPHDLHGVKEDDLPKNSFLANLLIPEINCLKEQLETDINNVLQPLIGGGTVNIQPGEPIFNSEGGPPSTHYGSLQLDPGISGSALEEGQKHIRKALPLEFMKTKVSTILGGVDTINESSVMTPSQMAGEENFLTQYNSERVDVPVLTSEEFSDLFGLFDEYGWFKGDEVETSDGLASHV